MDNAKSIHGKWHSHRGDGFDADWDFATDGSVLWSGQSNGRSFACKGMYQLDQKANPHVLQISDVEILEIEAAEDGRTPRVEPETTLRFYQDFTDEGGMRLEGMAIMADRQPAVHEIQDRPGTVKLIRV